MNAQNLKAWLARLLFLLPWGISGWCGSTAWSQEQPAKPSSLPAPIQDPQAPQLGNNLDRDLTTKFRFREQYSETEQPAHLCQYDVAFKETLQVVSSETGQGAPRTQKIVRSGLYTERPLQVTEIDRQVIASVLRRYMSAEVDPDPFSKQVPPRLMKDLTIAIADPTAASPRLMSLSMDRPVREQEYRFVQNNPFTPAIGLLIPNTGLQLKQTWTVSRTALSALMGEPASGMLEGKLVAIEVDKADEKRELARIELQGKIQTASGPTVVKGLCRFLFQVPEEAATGPVEAIGGITWVSLKSVTTVAATANSPASERRRDLLLERRLISTEQPLSAPDLQLEHTVENSWLLYVDPESRYHFQHPQDFKLEISSLGEKADHFTLVREFGKTPDLIALTYTEEDQPKPEVVFKPMLDRYRDLGFDIIPGAMKRMPADEWGDETEVYRVEAVLGPPPGAGAPVAAVGGRVHFDGYVMLFNKKASLTATLYTAREDVGVLRTMVEQILKQFRTGPPTFIGAP